MNKYKQTAFFVGAFSAGVLVSLQFSAYAGRDASGLPVDQLHTFAEVYNAVKQGYVEPIKDNKMMENAINGMLSNLDPHSSYLDAEAYKELQVGTHGEFGGLGIEVNLDKSGLVNVISPIEDTPAHRAGIKAGDFIYKIDGKSVKGLTLNQAVKLMRGKPNSKIKLSILRKGASEPLEFTLTREVIKVRSVRSQMIEPGYGYIRITQFQETTLESLVKQLKELNKTTPLKGLVLDLRNDPGGLLYSAIGVSAAFINQNDLVVSTEGRNADAKQKYFARAEDYARNTGDLLSSLPASFKKVPMVVIVNSGSASASEIVAGALQDHKRAKILGIKTFGKGSVQTVMPLPDNTAIKLTTARYFTPSGRSIQAKGIMPDFYVNEDPDVEEDPNQNLREADLERHLMNGMEANEQKKNDKSALGSDAKAKKAKQDCEDPKNKKEIKRLEYGSKEDYQLQQAMNHLKGLPLVLNKVPVEKPDSDSDND